MEKCLSSTPIKNEKNIYQMCTKSEVHIFNVRTIIMESLNIKEVKLLELLFVCFVALRPKSTAMVTAGRSVHLTTLFPGQA